ncbi:uncharacterized protein LOC141605420 [Silene latifolia]|uniref:uncharacterized protein LOC141605420 n=1 Tax=Silene latifolia TaxID=37657 RepID=UPI003D76EC7F
MLPEHILLRTPFAGPGMQKLDYEWGGHEQQHCRLLNSVLRKQQEKKAVDSDIPVGDVVESKAINPHSVSSSQAGVTNWWVSSGSEYGGSTAQHPAQDKEGNLWKVSPDALEVQGYGGKGSQHPAPALSEVIQDAENGETGCCLYCSHG